MEEKCRKSLSCAGSTLAIWAELEPSNIFCHFPTVPKRRAHARHLVVLQVFVPSCIRLLLMSCPWRHISPPWRRTHIAFPFFLVTESQILARHTRSTEQHLPILLATYPPNDVWGEAEKNYLEDADSIQREWDLLLFLSADLEVCYDGWISCSYCGPWGDLMLPIEIDRR